MEVQLKAITTQRNELPAEVSELDVRLKVTAGSFGETASRA